MLFLAGITAVIKALTKKSYAKATIMNNEPSVNNSKQENRLFNYDMSQRGNTPRYLFLYRQIRDDILNGRIRPGEKLPSKRRLAKALSVGVLTVENAYRQLLLEGYIESKQRSGYFANNVGRVLETDKTELDSAAKELETEGETFNTDLQANRTVSREFPVATWFKLLRKVIAENPPDLFDTVPYNGLIELRKAIAAYLLRARGMHVSPSQIIIGAGTEYLYSRLIQLLDPSATFVFENPGYQKLSRIADNYHVPWTYCNVDKSGMMVNRLRKTNGTVVHVSPANNFPGGFTMSVARRKELLHWANEDDSRYIIEDDYDSELRFEGNPLLPLFANDTHEKVIYLNTFSKTLMPSLRISYMILPKHLMKRYQETMSFYSCTVSGFEQRALAKFLDEGYFERHIAHLRNHYRKQREAVMSAIRNSDLASISRIIENNAGTHFLLILETSYTAREIKQAVAQHGINLALLNDYCFKDYPVAKKTLVVNYASLSADEVEETVNKLAAALA